jgi:hypothetical protein
MGTGILSWGVTLPGRYVDHSPPPSDEIKNEWSYTSTPPTFLHGIDRGNFPFYIHPVYLMNDNTKGGSEDDIMMMMMMMMTTMIEILTNLLLSL